MAPKERTEIVETLERSRQEFIAAVAGVDEAQAKVRPDAARWSVLDCVEHVTMVEERFLGWLKVAQKLDTPRVDKEKEANLLVRVAVEQFNANRTRSIEFAQERSDELYSLAAEHPRFGPMNGVEFLIIVAAHGRRHAAQIQEVRGALSAT